MQPTKRQLAVLNFIRQYSARKGFPPTIRDIGKRFRIGSPNGVVCHLTALEKKGLIQRVPGRARTLQPTGRPPRLAATRRGRQGFPTQEDQTPPVSLSVRRTERQLEVLAFIAAHQEDYGYPPTIREIGSHLGIRSPNGVICHLRPLEKARLIRRVPHTSRSVQVIAWPSGTLFPKG